MKQAVDDGSDVKSPVDAAKTPTRWNHVSPVMFPPGTNPQGTQARPEVWSDRAGSETAAATFVTAAQESADMAEANEGGLRPAIHRHAWGPRRLPPRPPRAG